MFVGAEPLGVFAGATTRRDIAKLVIIVRSPTVATDHAAIGVWTKPLEPPEVLPLRACELYAPPLSPPSSVAGPPPNRCRITTGPPPRRRRTTASPPLDHRQTTAGLKPDHRRLS
ncbi:hypothetical protein DY000_02060089 [Brassica cretica]|uniref:Uncharacterized protein n=1 Tax=Brassica cretica TaxID=69181 RepID=A0ABQ7AS20_BRACR|nr:hypothetical protein DY000_02060089 [Brassica cretica]